MGANNLKGKLLVLVVLFMALSVTGCNRNVDVNTVKYEGQKTQNKIEKSKLNDEDKEILNQAIKTYSEDELLGKTLKEIMDIQKIDSYKKDITTLNAKIIATSSELETIAKTYIKVWNSSINMTLDAQRFADVLGTTTNDFVIKTSKPSGTYYAFKGNFDDALKYTKEYFTKTKKFENVEKEYAEINATFKDFKNPPDNLKEAYEVLLKIYGDYDKLYNLSMSPTGSLITYCESVNEVIENIVSNCKELDIRLSNN